MDEIATLAAAAALTVVTAMATDTWTGVRGKIAKLFRRPDREKDRALMHTEQTARLAAEGGEALVAAMPTPTWPALREETVEMLHVAGPALEGELVPELDVNARMLAAASPEHVAVLREVLASRWSENLLRVLAASPGADEALRRLVERIRAAAPAAERVGKTMTNIAKDQSRLFAVMDGNIIQHHHPNPSPRERSADNGDDNDDGGDGAESK